MSLPVRRPHDDQLPIIRQDGQYTLVITPKSVVTRLNGTQQLQSIGVPYGTMPRLILIHIMTEAVRTKSRHIALGDNFTDWMRRMGYRTFSYGPRGSATLLREQLDRLLACEWMIRWDNDKANGDHEFGIREIKLSNEYVGVDRKAGSFMRQIIMTEGFFGHLKDHAVPLNEHAIRQLRDSATALDLYTWLAYRLPRIAGSRPATLTWSQLAVHFGNDGKNIRKFRQTIRDAWDRNVSAVYPEAKADFGTGLIKLHSSPPPLHQKPVRGLALVATTDGKGTVNDRVESKGQLGDTLAHSSSTAETFLQALNEALGVAVAKAWLRGVTMEIVEGQWVLLAETHFKASWIGTHFDTEIRKAGQTAGITETVRVRVRPV
ncbi:replication protein RepA [Acidiphilium sp.]|uniref:replication protein RepA n=1 Tax=Acidiphilium sp. TaxID=527 RepID=UPI003D077C5E